jgi:hypothetical protein
MNAPRKPRKLVEVGLWLLFSLIWLGVLLTCASLPAPLTVSGSALLGFLTLCAKDVVMARLHQSRMRDEYLRNNPPARRFTAEDQS